MNWSDFIKVAHPEDKKLDESGHGIVWLLSRRVGLMLAYVFYHMGFSANNVSFLCPILAVIATFLLSTVSQECFWWPVLGLLLMDFQIILDFTDGPIARVQGKCNELGGKMDDLGNCVSRAAIIILFGYFTKSAFMLWVSVVSGFVLSAFWDSTTNIIFKNKKFGKLRKLFMLSYSVIFVLIFLPIIIVLFGVLGLPLQEMSYVATCCYAALAILWLIMCCL